LLQKIKERFPNGIQYLKSKDAIVKTKSVTDWRTLINQRVRWASKTSEVKNGITKAMGWIVFLTNLLVIVGAFYCLFNARTLGYFLLFIGTKLLLDFWLFSKTRSFFTIHVPLIYFYGASLLYPFVTIIVVLKSIHGGYIWKGRRLKK